jgi:hypothetical protein
MSSSVPQRLDRTEPTTPPLATAARSEHLAAGAIIGAVSLVLGPLLGSIGTLLRYDVWTSTYPDYPLVDKYHDQNVLGTQLVTLGFPVLVVSVFATAWVSRRSHRLTGIAVLTSVFGLAALAGKAVQNSTIIAMAGIHDHETLDTLVTNISNESPIVLWMFPLYVLGSLLLGIALWRSRAVPRWSAVLVGIGALAPISVLTGAALLGPVIAVLRIIGSIPLIKILLNRTPDDALAGGAN